VRGLVRGGVVVSMGVLLAGVPRPAMPGAEPVRLRFVGAVLAGPDGRPLARPEGLACAPGVLAVADTGNGRVVRYAVSGESASPAGEFRLAEAPDPIRVEFDGQGGFFVLDGRSRKVAHAGPNGEFLGFVGGQGTVSPATRSLRLGPDRSLYLLDAASARVLVLDFQGRVRRSVGFPEKTGFVSDLAVNSQGRIFLVDSVGSRLLVADREEPTARALTGSLREELDFAVALAADPRGRLFVADQSGGGIVVFGEDGSFLGRQGQMGWAEGEFRYPAAVCADGEGKLYVADRENHRVQVFAIGP